MIKREHFKVALFTFIEFFSDDSTIINHHGFQRNVRVQPANISHGVQNQNGEQETKVNLYRYPDIEMFYLNSTLNFGIPPVLVFQLEVYYYKVERLLTGLTAQQ